MYHNTNVVGTLPGAGHTGSGPRTATGGATNKSGSSTSRTPTREDGLSVISRAVGVGPSVTPAAVTMPAAVSTDPDHQTSLKGGEVVLAAVVLMMCERRPGTCTR